MRHALNLIRKVIVCGLTYSIAFLGTLTVVAAATKTDTTTWMPLLLGFVFYVALGLLPPFKEAILRLVLTALFASGALSLWFISEPPAASEPNQRFTIYVLFLGAIGPFLCGLLLCLLYEERRIVPRKAMNFMFSLLLLGWVISYFSEWHSLTGLHHMAAAGIRFASQVGNGHVLPHRRLLQVGFFGLSTVCAWGLTRASGVGLSRRAVVCVLLAGCFALFDVTRIHFEITIPFSISNLLLDGMTIGVVFLLCEVIGRGQRRDATS